MTKTIISTPCCHVLDDLQLIVAECSIRSEVRADPNYSRCAVEG